MGRWRDIRTQRETPIYLEPDTEPVDSEDEFLQVLYRFFKRIVVMGLSDHVDLSAFYSIVIHPHLPDGPFGQIWEFGYSLLVVFLKRMDEQRYTCFLPMLFRCGQTPKV